MRPIYTLFSLAVLSILPFSTALADFGHRSRPEDDCNRPKYSSSNFGNVYAAPQQRRHSYNYNRYNYENQRNNTPIKQINYGIRSGQLSYDEARELNRDLYYIKEQERKFYSDGYLSKREEEKLREQYNDFRKNLKHELNDGERRW